MAKQYKGSLSLEWYNKQKAILLRSEEETKTSTDIPAPKINWVNKDDALFYEINQEEGKGLSPYWVDRNDIRVKEARPLVFQSVFKAISKDKKGSLPGLNIEYKTEEIHSDDSTIENILIKGDNLLALNTLKKIFDNKPEEEKIKCIYIDPPYNTQNAFLSEYYEDNLEHSEWLTLMRDRFVKLYDLLRNDGVLVVHLDDQEIFYCKVLLDEIFGRSNFINSIAIKSSTPSGVKTAHKNKTIIKQKDIILIYRKSDSLRINPQYKRKEKWDTHFNYFVDKKNKTVTPFITQLIKDGILLSTQKISDFDINNKLHYQYYLKNADFICQTQSHKNETLKKASLELKDKVLITNEDTEDEAMFYNGRQLSPLSSSLNYVYHNDTQIKDFSVLLCDFWDDIDFQNTQNEGGVSFPNSKKPEELILRILNLFTEENQFVLDCFGGSGTTFAVAHKMNRKWIGIEMGNHADSHIIPRLKAILNGTDVSGITGAVNWKGGGAFKYYHLGESIIKMNKDGSGDFNWSLGKEFIQESFLSSYDYIIDTSINFQEGELFADKKHQPMVGVQTIGTKKRVAVITLNEPKGKLETLSYEEMQSIYKTVKKKYSPEYINIFTNRGIEIAYDSKPDDLEVVKVPNAIFAELEK